MRALPSSASCWSALRSPATLDAHGDFNLEEIIGHGYPPAVPSAPRRPPDLKAETRFAVLFHVAGIAMIIAGISGIFFGR